MLFRSFTDDVIVEESEEGCDVPIDILQLVVTTSACADATFGVDTSGVVIRTGAAEVLEDVDGDGNDVTDLDAQATPVLAASGHRCCKKYGATHYEGADWESH